MADGIDGYNGRKSSNHGLQAGEELDNNTDTTEQVLVVLPPGPPGAKPVWRTVEGKLVHKGWLMPQV